MKAAKLAMIIVAGALVSTAPLTAAVAQAPSTVYVLHSGPVGSCPNLDWHIVLGENGDVNGVVSWDNMKSYAHVTGTVDADKKIMLTAQQVGGAGAGQTATITGDAHNDGWLVLNLRGTTIACEGIKVPVWRQQ